MIIICIITTIENFKINDGFLILCLKINIASNEPTLPPINVLRSKFFSDTLEMNFPDFTDCSLS